MKAKPLPKDYERDMRRASVGEGALGPKARCHPEPAIVDAVGEG